MSRPCGFGTVTTTSPDHELVPAVREGAVEPERPEALDELPAGAPRGHQLACLTRTTAFSSGERSSPSPPGPGPLLDTSAS
jgi:hypothetical protein